MVSYLVIYKAHVEVLRLRISQSAVRRLRIRAWGRLSENSAMPAFALLAKRSRVSSTYFGIRRNLLQFLDHFPYMFMVLFPLIFRSNALKTIFSADLFCACDVCCLWDGSMNAIVAAILNILIKNKIRTVIKRRNPQNQSQNGSNVTNRRLRHSMN